LRADATVFSIPIPHQCRSDYHKPWKYYHITGDIDSHPRINCFLMHDLPMMRLPRQIAVVKAKACGSPPAEDLEATIDVSRL
jgi:hypothetical protein